MSNTSRYITLVTLIGVSLGVGGCYCEAPPPPQPPAKCTDGLCVKQRRFLDTLSFYQDCKSKVKSDYSTTSAIGNSIAEKAAEEVCGPAPKRVKFK
jgi:hypothetical protein